MSLRIVFDDTLYGRNPEHAVVILQYVHNSVIRDAIQTTNFIRLLFLRIIKIKTTFFCS